VPVVNYQRIDIKIFTTDFRCVLAADAQPFPHNQSISCSSSENERQGVIKIYDSAVMAFLRKSCDFRTFLPYRTGGASP